MNAAVFLDRDNTIIHNDGDLGDPDLVRLIQGAASAIASLRGLNYKIIVITNQGGVARGKYGEEDVEKTNQRVADLVKAASGTNIDRFYYCPYHPQGSVPEYTCEHEWRKPQPGMLLQAAKDMNIDLSQSWMVGDQMRDVQAGVAAGTRCILLRADAQEPLPSRGDQLKSGQIETTDNLQHFTARNMVEAVRIIAKHRKPEAEQVGDTSHKKWDPAAAKAARASMSTPSDTSTPTSASQDKIPPSSPAQSQANLATPASPAKPAKVAKPFKPWGATGPVHQTTKTPVAPEPVVTKEAEEPSHVAADTTDPNLEPHEVQAMVAADEASAAGKPAVHATTDEASDSATGKAAASDESSTSRRPSPSSDVTLRQILQELRGQRTVQNDFSYVRMVAIVLQIVAVFMLVAGLLLGATDADLFLRWISTAILVQLAAIAMLLLER